ncbi:pilus assembly protein PilN [Rossellomorea vietnamensis]|uniref:Pilus assembly protein PilN n=1 Tax=Rossellomorea vietnamensis TaxID=218284 RepID=A0ACD4C7M4_9BACI|nr:pilus assembly protein PilN [Rossellomorea vietnamensis]UXH44239.1 pilus assembly protein PilN [Rossellomorea vietnamensis]
MLVDINLLPQNEKRSRQWLYVVAGVISLGILALIILFILAGNLGKDVDALTAQLQSEKQLRAEKEQSISDFESSDAWVQLEDAVSWVEDYPIDTVPVLDHLVELLPERGFLKEFTYAEDGSIQLSIQFDTSSEAAYYLTHLKDSKYTQDAKLSSLATESVMENEQAAVNTEPVLPRYIGQYEVILNRDSIKEIETEADEQGGDSE